MSRLLPFLLFSLFTACFDDNNSTLPQPQTTGKPDSLKIISDIPVPRGYERVVSSKDSFAEWLRSLSLKKDNHVYLYNGQLKRRQGVQFAVLDISVGNKDLQQCADAVMRLRAEYLFHQKRFSEIEFRDNAGKSYKWTGGSDRAAFANYLEKVFGMCGSASLEKQLKPKALADIQAGDVLIKGGFPGHAMIVVDVAKNNKGKRIYMLAQSYMPAQIFISVRNPADDKLSPWYEVTDSKEIFTPEWTFSSDQLRRW